jgi:hypothetical protein
MSAAASHVGCTDPAASSRAHGDDDDDDDDGSVSSSVPALLDRIKVLETDLRMHTVQAGCDAANIKLQAERIAALEAALAAERETHAQALMRMSRTCEDRAREHTANIAKLESAHDARIADRDAFVRELKVAHGAVVACKDDIIADLKASRTDSRAHMDALNALDVDDRQCAAAAIAGRVRA